jgi:hypothetical protein
MSPSMLRSHTRHAGAMSTRWTLLVVGLLVGALARSSAAAPVIDWDPAYFYEPGATPTSSTPGAEMKIVGVISAFGPPLDFLDATDPSKDYTFYLSGLISDGTGPPIGPPGTEFYITTYHGGTIEIYEGTPRDSDFDPFPPVGFTDGTLLLSGNVSGFYTQTNNFTPFMTGNAEANITWTGGSLLGYLGGENPCPALFTGGITWYPPVMIAGYLFRHDGKIDHECATPARTSTWGRMKKLYR